jgi:hypothetical protein
MYVAHACARTVLATTCAAGGQITQTRALGDPTLRGQCDGAAGLGWDRRCTAVQHVHWVLQLDLPCTENCTNQAVTFDPHIRKVQFLQGCDPHGVGRAAMPWVSCPNCVKPPIQHHTSSHGTACKEGLPLPPPPSPPHPTFQGPDPAPHTCPPIMPRPRVARTYKQGEQGWAGH